MSFEDSAQPTPTPRRDGETGAVEPAEPRSWLRRPPFEDLARAPIASLPMPGRGRIHLATDRVRAAPALTPTLVSALGNGAIGLGVIGLAFPKTVGRLLGLRAPPPVIQLAFGAREMWTGLGLASDPTKASLLWTRVAGDAFDIAVLRALDRRDNPRRGAARAALGAVLAVTALDVLAAVRMTNVKRNRA